MATAPSRAASCHVVAPSASARSAGAEARVQQPPRPTPPPRIAPVSPQIPSTMYLVDRPPPEPQTIKNAAFLICRGSNGKTSFREWSMPPPPSSIKDISHLHKQLRFSYFLTKLDVLLLLLTVLACFRPYSGSSDSLGIKYSGVQWLVPQNPVCTPSLGPAYIG